MARGACLRVRWSPLGHLLSSLSTCKNLSRRCLGLGNLCLLHHWCNWSVSCRWGLLRNGRSRRMHCWCSHILRLSLLLTLWHSVCIEILMYVHDSLSVLLLWLRVLHCVESFLGWHSQGQVSNSALLIEHDCHLITQLVRDVAHIALLSEWEVVVVATLAHPVARSFMCSLGLLEYLLRFLIQLEWWFVNSFGWCLVCRFGLLSVNLKALDLHGLPFLLELEWWCLLVGLHVRWFSSSVLRCLGFLTPIAFLSPLKVVVLTFRTLPSSLWEFEISLRFFQMTLFTRIVWRNAWCALSFRRSLSRIRLLVTVLVFITTVFLQWSSLINLKVDPSHIFL